VRRTVVGLAAFLAMTGTFVILPVYASPGPVFRPVEPSIEEVDLGSVAAPEGDAVVTTDGEPQADAASTSPTAAPSPPATGAPATEQPAEEVASSGDELPGVPALTVSQPETEPFSAVGVTWAQGDVTDVVVQLRVRDADGDWGQWTSIEADDIEQSPSAATAGATSSGDAARGGTAPYWTGEAHGVEVIVQGAGGAIPDDVTVALVDPGESPADALTQKPAAKATAHAAEAMPAVYSRAQWGADESIRTWDPEYAKTLKAATIHHTADRNTYSADEVPAMMRSIYAYHTVTRGWGDIGYNVIVDRFGRMFEGRYGGLASTVIGAHAGGFNTYTFGVSMLGNYDTVAVPQGTVNAVSEIIAWKFGLYGIDPNGSTTLVSGGGGTAKYAAGTPVGLPTIFGHRDVGSTACPGNYGYARLGEIRQRVTNRFPAYNVAVNTVAQQNASTGNIADLSPMMVGSVLSSNGSTTVFVRGSDGSIFYRTGRETAEYTGWESIPGLVTTSGPAAVSTDGTRVDLAVRGPSNALYRTSAPLDPGTGRPGSWAPWENLGGVLTTAPGIASVGTNRLAVAGRGTDGAIWRRVFDGSEWAPWASLGGYASSAPAIEADLVDGTWRYIVSVVGTDLSIWKSPFPASSERPSGAWTSARTFSGHGLGSGNSTANFWAPKIMTSGGGDHSVVLVDTTVGWAVRLGGGLTSTASVTRQADGGVVVFARGTDKALWMVHYGRDGVGTWTSLGGEVA
jgi:hypothetical protein